MTRGLLLLLLLAPRRQDDAERLTLVTYNVLADEKSRVKERVPALMKILADSKADVIALQEVAPWFLDLLAKEEWAKPYKRDKTVEPGGQYFLTRWPVESSVVKVLPGRQRRTVLVITLKLRGRTVRIATTHMESPLEEGKTRAKQLDAIFPLLKDADDAVLLGDFNFGDGEKPDSDHLDPAYVDAWTALKPKDPGCTWNMEASQMARRGSFPGEKSRRIDRILVRSTRWTPKEIRIVGDAPVVEGKADLFPSDHFGLVATLEWKK